MGKAWMAEGHDTFVEHLYLPGWELRRKKRAEESSEDTDIPKRVRYNSESEVLIRVNNSAVNLPKLLPLIPLAFSFSVQG